MPLLSMLLPLLTGGAGSLAGRALLARLLPSMAGKAIPSMLSDIAGFGVGQAAGTMLMGDEAVERSSNEEAFSRMMGQGPQPTVEEQPIDYGNMLAGMGVDMRQLTPEVF